MKLRLGSIALAFVSVVSAAMAQTTSSSAAATSAPAQVPGTSTVVAAAQVPRLVKFSGAVQNVNSAASGVVSGEGATPTNIVGITFSLYSEQSGGAPLWSEVQNVQIDKTGHYTVQLGSTQPDGLPVELFTSAQAQWLGVRQEGQAEQPRIMLLSVPYALKAADSETFGGKPPSAFMPARDSSVNYPAGAGLNRNAKQGPLPPVGGSGTTNYIALWTSSSNLGNSAIYQSGGNVGIGTTSPGYPLTVNANNPGDAALITQSNASGIAVDAIAFGATGVALSGYAESSSGNNIGVRGESLSSSGFGVMGKAAGSSGVNYGVVGESFSPSGAGVLGKAETTTGAVRGVIGLTASATGRGVEGDASATTGDSFGVVGSSSSDAGTGVLGQATSTAGTTVGVAGLSDSSDGVGVKGSATGASGHTFGVAGDAESPDGTGVYGEATSATGISVGVYGTSSSTGGSGVVGAATAETGAAFGVKGTTESSAGVGVYAIATSTAGVNYGVEGTNASPDGVAVFGQNNSTTGDAVGTWGQTDSTEGIGAYGLGMDASVVSVNERPIGVWGATNQTGGIGILGTTDNAIAVAGSNNASSVATADFINEEDTRIDAAVLVTRGTNYDGLCLIDVSGNLNCTGSKSAVVPVDGGTRKVALYAVEAPENWFEDIGSARLSHGSAVVALESTFAQTVNSGVEYHVFLTPKGDCKGLYVSNESADGFEVRELGRGTANIAFDYRIVARRKGYEDIRLADRTETFAAAVAERKIVAPNSTGGQTEGSTHSGPPAARTKHAATPKVRN